MIDVSHANSSKQHQRQIQVTTEIAEQIAQGDPRIIGLMMESHLQEGRQDLSPGQALRRGVSITDPCMSFAQTQPLLQLLAESVARRRAVIKGEKRS
jgi:3-deoxy-7-phosphoheptulonate synthase